MILLKSYFGAFIQFICSSLQYEIAFRGNRSYVNRKSIVFANVSKNINNIFRVNTNAQLLRFKNRRNKNTVEQYKPLIKHTTTKNSTTCTKKNNEKSWRKR